MYKYDHNSFFKLIIPFVYISNDIPLPGYPSINPLSHISLPPPLCLYGNAPPPRASSVYSWLHSQELDIRSVTSGSQPQSWAPGPRPLFQPPPCPFQQSQHPGPRPNSYNNKRGVVSLSPNTETHKTHTENKKNKSLK